MRRARFASWPHHACATAAAIGAVLWSGPAAAAGADVESDLAALARVLPQRTRDLCVVGRSGGSQCLAQVVTVESGADLVEQTPRGLGPVELQSAYALPSTGGHGRVVAAILPPYDYPNAARDLATYRQQFGLSACSVSASSGRIAPTLKEIFDGDQDSNVRRYRPAP